MDVVYEYMFIYQRCKCNSKKNKPYISNGKIQSTANILKLVSVSSRLSILLLLDKGPHCVCDIMAHTKISQTLASHYLSNLAKANLVSSKKNANFVDYKLTAGGRHLVFHLRQLID